MRVFTCWVLPAPVARATRAVMPTPRDMMMPLIRKMGELLMETDAVAPAPREPTMAVSAKLTRVVKICSTSTGQAKRMMVMAALRDSSVTLRGLPERAIRESSCNCVLFPYIIAQEDCKGNGRRQVFPWDMGH